MFLYFQFFIYISYFGHLLTLDLTLASSRSTVAQRKEKQNIYISWVSAGKDYEFLFIPLRLEEKMKRK